VFRRAYILQVYLLPPRLLTSEGNLFSTCVPGVCVAASTALWTLTKNLGSAPLVLRIHAATHGVFIISPGDAAAAVPTRASHPAPALICCCLITEKTMRARAGGGRPTRPDDSSKPTRACIASQKDQPGRQHAQAQPRPRNTSKSRQLAPLWIITTTSPRRRSLRRSPRRNGRRTYGPRRSRSPA
jgi:hypothetical protein